MAFPKKGQKGFQKKTEQEAPETVKEDTPRRKRPRVSLGGHRQKLSYPEMPGYQLRWVNDSSNRLEQFKDAGYEFVEKDPNTHPGDGDISQRMSVDSRVRASVGVHEDGSPLYAYLMKQSQEFYDEDQRAKQIPIDELEETLMRGFDSEGRMPEGRYIPATGPKLTRK